MQLTVNVTQCTSRSVYSASQIVGGVLLAVVSDRGLLSRRGVLILSFAGAALSYTIVGFANSVPLLLFSRVVVGLVKQTMTTSSTMVAECTTSKDRAAAMGRLGTAMTLGWMSGQALGGVLASRVHMSAPPAVAVLLYAVDTVFVLLFISGPPNIASPTTSTTSTSVSASSSATSGNVTTKPRAQGTMALLRSVLQDRGTAKVLAVQAAYDVVTYGLYVFRVGGFCSFFFFFLSSFFLLLSPVSASIFLFHLRLFLLLLLAAVLPFPAVLLVPALFFLLLFFLRCASMPVMQRLLLMYVPYLYALSLPCAAIFAG